MPRHIVIIGGLASGKTTLAKYLAAHYGYTRIATYTTRPIRPGEVEGEDYYFLNKKEFDDLVKANFFFETTNYNTIDGVWSYGSSSYPSSLYDKTVVVLNPHGASLIKGTTLLVWLDLPVEIAMQRALTRGDAPLEIARRVLADANDFDSEDFEKNRCVRIKEVVDLPELAACIDDAAMTIGNYRTYLEWKEAKKP